MTSRAREDNENCKRKHYIAPCGELGLEEAMDLSQDRLRGEWVRFTPNTHVHTA